MFLGRSMAALILAMLALAPTPLRAQRADLLVPLPDLEARAMRDSLDPLAAYDLALGYWVKRRYDEAERALRRSIAIESKFAPGYLALAYLPYARQPKLWKELDRKEVSPESAAIIDQSFRMYRRAFIVDPMVDLKVHGLAIPPRPALVVGYYANNVYVALVRGFEGFWNGQYQQAYDLLDRVLNAFDAKHQDDIPDVLLWYHGLAAAHTRQFDAALADFHRLLDRARDRERTDTLVRTFALESNEIRYVLATIYRRGQRPEQALPLYQEALSQDLSLYMAHAQLAEIYEERQQWLDAVTERRRALETNPEDTGLQYDLGRTLARSRDFPEAAQVLTAAMEANPYNTRIPYTLGQVLLRLGDREGARKVFDRFIAAAPSRFSPQVAEVRKQLAGLEQ